MRFRTLGFGAIGGLLCLAVAAAQDAPPRTPGSDNPRLNLRIENRTLPQIVEALSRETGISLRLVNRADDPVTPASFDWRGVSLAQAMRELCDRFRLEVSRHADGSYTFVAGRAAANAAGARAPQTTTADGYTVLVRGVSVLASR